MSVTVEKLISDFNLEVLVEGEKDVKISVNDINRPGLQLAGFYNYFAPKVLFLYLVRKFDVYYRFTFQGTFRFFVMFHILSSISRFCTRTPPAVL